MKLPILSLIATASVLFSHSAYSQIFLNIDSENKTYFFSGSTQGAFEWNGDSYFRNYLADGVISFTQPLPDSYFNDVLIGDVFIGFLGLGVDSIVIDFATHEPLAAEGIGTLRFAETVSSYASASPEAQAYFESLVGSPLIAGYGTFQMQVQAIPEPGTFAFLGAGGLALLSLSRKRRHG